MEFSKPKVIISKCIEFDHCRYDGSMVKSDIVKKLKPYIDFYPVCPEMEMGLSCPRDVLRVILKEDGDEALIFSKTGEDVTRQMQHYLENKIPELQQVEADGFLLKNRSPSCGINTVKIYKGPGKAIALPKKTKGFFGKAIVEVFPHLVIEDEGRLMNYHIREHFYTRIYTQASFRELKQTLSIHDLVKFHSKNKYLFMAYHPNHLKELGRIVANHKNLPIQEVILSYEQTMIKLLNALPKPMRFVNVMLHIFGYFSKELNAKEKAFFLDMLEQYRQGKTPQSTVLALLKSWVIRFNNEYLIEQTIFEPFPSELIQMMDSGKSEENE